MKRDKIIALIKEIEKEPNLNEEGYIATHYINDSFESFIVANKKGVVNFILHLLKALKDFDFHLSKEDHFSTIKLNKENWFDKNSHFKFDWIQPISEKKEEVYLKSKENSQKGSKLKERLFLIKMYSFFYGLRILALIGFVVSIKWLLKLIF